MCGKEVADPKELLSEWYKDWWVNRAPEWLLMQMSGQTLMWLGIYLSR